MTKWVIWFVCSQTHCNLGSVWVTFFIELLGSKHGFETSETPVLETPSIAAINQPQRLLITENSVRLLGILPQLHKSLYLFQKFLNRFTSSWLVSNHRNSINSLIEQALHKTPQARELFVQVCGFRHSLPVQPPKACIVSSKPKGFRFSYVALQ